MKYSSRAKNRSFIQSTMMPRRAALAVLAAAALTAPAAVPKPARAAGAMPGELVVGYRDGHERVLHSADPAAAIARLRARPGVVYAVPNVVAHASQLPLPDDPGRGTQPGGWQEVQWNFLGTGFGIDAPTAWQHAAAAGHPGAAGVTVAVLDTGVAYKNAGRYRRSPDLDAARFVRGFDFVRHGASALDRNGHGTHVASTIAEATNNGIALTGLAYNARIMPVRVLDSQGEGDAATIARGVRFAARRGAQVINLSLEFSTDVGASEIPELLDALEYAHRRGALVVAASGNEAHRSVAYPARARHVISVGATTIHGCLSDFSNDGRGLDLVAPGGGADAEIPDDPNCKPTEPPGPDIFQMTFLGTSAGRFGMPSGYEGTSMAVPHVAATAALIIASRVLGPHPTPDQLEARLKQTATDLGPPGYDTRYGAGLINAGRATDPSIAPAGTAVRSSG
ncbi:MAG: peptidase S8 [Actinobacteria bacterium]|nr:MAG: peptidase S8 [Actinomycetota bacterium]